MLNEPQNWSLSLSPSNTSYTLSLGKGAEPSRNKRCRYLCSVWGLLIPQLRDPGMCLDIPQAVFCSGVTPQLSHTEEASLLRQTRPLLHLWCHLLWGTGCPAGDERCCRRAESLPCTEQELHLPGSAAGARWPRRFLPPVPHSWRLRSGLCKCLRGRRGHSRCLFWSRRVSSPL